MGLDALFALICNQFGLGVLGLPSVLRDIRFGPRIVAIILIGLVSRYAGIKLLEFHARYSHVANIINMVQVVGGRPWAIVAAIGLVI